MDCKNCFQKQRADYWHRVTRILLGIIGGALGGLIGSFICLLIW